MTHPIIALITGSIRDPFECMPVLAKLVQYRSENLVDDIVFTTWASEFNKHPELFKKIEKLGIIIQFVGDIDNGGPSNMWRQYRLLEHGLRVCPKDSFVLKARTDKTIQILEKFKPVLELTKQNNFPKTNPGATQIFKYKLAVAYAGLNFLFFIKDIVFFGHRDDLRELTHFEAWFDLFSALPGIEWQWKAAPFFRKFPIFRDFSEIYKLSAFAKAFWEKPDETPDILVQILALYYHCLVSNFSMHMYPKDYSLEYSIEDILGGRATSICGYPPGPECTWVMSASTKLIEYITSGTLPASPLQSRLIAALNSSNTFEQDFLTPANHEEISRFYSQMGIITPKSPPIYAQEQVKPQSNFWGVMNFLDFENLIGFKINDKERTVIEKYTNEALNYSYLVPELIEASISSGDNERAMKWQNFGMKDPVMRMKGY